LALPPRENDEDLVTACDWRSGAASVLGKGGLLAQVIDLGNGTVIATIPSEEDPTWTEIISATISSFEG